MSRLRSLPRVSLVPTIHFSPTCSHLCVMSSDRANYHALAFILCPFLFSFSSFSVFAEANKMSLCPSPLLPLTSFPIHTSKCAYKASYTHSTHANFLKHLPSLTLSSFRKLSLTTDQKDTTSPYRNCFFMKLLLTVNPAQQRHKILSNGSFFTFALWP